MKEFSIKIPEYVLRTVKDLEAKGHEAFVVGGCVRDLLLGKQPKDWDITTSALPEDMLAIFPDGRYENAFGTVILPIRDGEVLQDVIEITTYRSEQGYSDRRHPDQVIFEKEIDKDLSRRDFTVNAMALGFKDSKIERLKDFTIEIEDYIIIDLFGGRKDLEKKIIRAVGEPVDRFKEDALRMMRAIRFACEHKFAIEEKTERAIVKLAGGLKFIANERIRDELVKILASEQPYEGIVYLYNTKLLQYILPELLLGDGVGQNRHHKETIYKHNLYSLKYCPNKEWQVRLAALLHDIGKAKTKKLIKDEFTFYNHEYVGAKMTQKICDRLKMSNEDKDRIVNLVRNHMFYYNVDEVTASSVRRLIVKVGKENLKDLIDIRIADRLGSGVAKAMPYKLRHLEYMFERVQNDPVSVKMLKINGSEVMELLGIAPGPQIGTILDVLLSEVIEDPALNTPEWLAGRTKELGAMDGAELRAKAKAIIEEKRREEDTALRQQHAVK